MGEYLILRLDAPLVSFGGPVVDHHGGTLDFPGRSLIAGLLGNALGYEHADAERLQALQDRIRYAVRCDRMAVRLVDYQTVDLGQPFLDGTGWTTWGRREDRRGGEASEGTHIRLRHYLADGIFTLALTLQQGEGPDLDEIERALREPERPLFIGRKPCLPAAPLLLGRVEAGSLLAALQMAEPIPASRANLEGPLPVWWPEGEPADEAVGASRLIYVADDRDWRNRIHAGRRAVRHGRLPLGGKAA